MAKRTANTNTQAAAASTSKDAAGFTLTGTLVGVYVGKKYAYATIKVQPAGSQYYDLYKVAYPLDTDFPDDGWTVSASGTMKKFKDEVSFTGTFITAV